MKYLRNNPFFKYAPILLFISYSISVFGYDPYDCLNDVARLDSDIPIGLATVLCSGAWSPEPVKCYAGISLLDEEIPRGIAIDLCAGSVNAEKTLECYAKGGSYELNRGLATTLCGANKTKN